MNPSSAILSAITTAGKLFGGYGAFTLGPVQMTGLAIPSSMPVGGEQKIVEHRLPGGYVMLDVMGPVYSEKHWTGYFDGQAALQTARTVEKMWQSGGQFKLAWNVSNYTVVIKSFNYEDKLIAPIKYDITCMVVADNSATSGETLTSMVLQVTSDLATGNPIAALSAVSQGVVGSSVSSALTAAGATGAATFGSAAYTTAVNAVNTASSALRGAAASADNLLAPLGVSLSSLSAAAPAGLATGALAQSITGALSSAGDIANLNVGIGFVRRAAANLQRASA
jgi:hypothetical protein